MDLRPKSTKPIPSETPDRIDNQYSTLQSEPELEPYPALVDVSPLTRKGELLTHNGKEHKVLTPGRDGQVLVADPRAEAGLAYRDLYRIVYKKSATTRISTSTLADDPELKIETAPFRIYVIDLVVFMNSGATPDFKWALVHSGTTQLMRYSAFSVAMGATTFAAVQTRATAGTSEPLVSGSSGEGALHISAILQTGAAGGVLSFQWAQNTLTGSNTIVNEGSYMRVEDVVDR